MRSASGPLARAISSSTRPNPACVDDLALRLDLGERIDGHARRLQPPPALAARTARAPGSASTSAAGSVEPGEPVPLLALVDALARAQLVHLRLGHQPGVVVLVALERQAVALDGVGDEADGLIAPAPPRTPPGWPADRARRGWSSGGRVRHRRAGARWRACRDGWRDPARAAAARPRRPETRAPSRACWGSRRSTRLRRWPPGSANARCSSLPYLMSTTFQPRFSNRRRHLHEQAVRHHRVEALAVVVDHPPAVLEAVLPVFEQRLVDVALVDLGIAHQRDHAPLGPVGLQPLACT